MKYIILTMFFIYTNIIYAKDDNYIEKVKLANEFKANAVAADANDLSILAKAADSWFYSKSFNNYMRVETNDIRYEIPISTLKSDGFLKSSWALRYGSKETTVLNHPYVVGVTRRIDPNGSNITMYSDPNEKYRFDMAIYIGTPGGLILPPRGVRNPVFLRFQRHYPGYTGYMTNYLNLDRISESGLPTDDVSQMVFATTMTSPSGVSNYLRNQFGFNSPLPRRELPNTLAQRFPEDFSLAERSVVHHDDRPAFICTMETLVSDAAWDAFLDRADVIGPLDEFYDRGDRAFLCTARVDPYFQVKAKNYFCSGSSKITNGRETIFTDIRRNATAGMSYLGKRKSSEHYGSPLSDWTCTVPNSHGIFCDNEAAIECVAAPPPDPCTGSNQPPSCSSGPGDKCDMYKKDKNGNAIFSDLIATYPTTCNGTIDGDSVLSLAVVDSAGRCEIYAPDRTIILCEEYLDLFWDEDKNSQPDGPKFYSHTLLENATSSTAIDTAQTDYNSSVSVADKAQNCSVQPVDTTTPHESLCQKVFDNPNVTPPSIRKLIVVENYWARDTCDPLSVGNACSPEILDRQCTYRIKPWRGDDWPMIAGTEASAVSAGCRISSDQKTIFCHRSMRVSSLPNCGRIGASVTIDWIDLPENTGVLIDKI
ncbi:MAG: hypothetical protein QM504_03335 [Pseudomonadota bacterium]